MIRLGRFDTGCGCAFRSTDRGAHIGGPPIDYFGHVGIFLIHVLVYGRVGFRTKLVDVVVGQDDGIWGEFCGFKDIEGEAGNGPSEIRLNGSEQMLRGRKWD